MPEAVVRPADGVLYDVRHSRCNFSHPGALAYLPKISIPSIPRAPDGNVFPDYLAWYLDRTHPYITSSVTTEEPPISDYVRPTSSLLIGQLFVCICD